MRRWRRDTILYAVLVQVALLGLTIFVVVIRPGAREEPAFTAKHTVRLPQRELEHRVALADFQHAAAAPLRLETLTTAALLPPDLPALPAAPRVEVEALDDADFLARDAQALLAQAGLAGTMNGLKSAASTAAFFGVEATGERIVLVVNTSVSVRNRAKRRGVSWQRIQDEVIRMVDGLESSTRFGLVQFSQGVRLFHDTLVPATTANREAVRAWVRESLRGNPPVREDDVWFGHEAALAAAFQLEPDVIFLVTDGVLDRREVRGGRITYPRIDFGSFIASVRRFAAGSPREAVVHVIGFDLDARAQADMQRLCRAFNGRLRTF